MPEVTVLPDQGCRRSRKILGYLEQHAIPFTRIDLESDEGQALAERYSLRASPGILPGCSTMFAAFLVFAGAMMLL